MMMDGAVVVSSRIEFMKQLTANAIYSEPVLL